MADCHMRTTLSGEEQTVLLSRLRRSLGTQTQPIIKTEADPFSSLREPAWPGGKALSCMLSRRMQVRLDARFGSPFCSKSFYYNCCDLWKLSRDFAMHNY